jgi:putative sigma-54 modulation protein
MQLTITGHHVDVTDPLRDYVTTKLQRLERHFDHLVNIHVILSVAKLEQKAEATIQLSGAMLHADMVHADMYAAIDGLVDRLDRQVVKHKEKITDHHRSEGAAHKAHAE